MAQAPFWINGPWPGRLAVGLRPRGGDWLGADMQAWRDEGVQVVVSLLEAQELRELELEGEPEACRALGLTFRTHPIPDRGLPAAQASVSELAESLAEDIRAGHSVLVHCRQGIGRSALLASAVLTVLGDSPEEALGRVELARGRRVPDTTEQRTWILGFSRARKALGDLEQDKPRQEGLVIRSAGGAVRGG